MFDGTDLSACVRVGFEATKTPNPLHVFMKRPYYLDVIGGLRTDLVNFSSWKTSTFTPKPHEAVVRVGQLLASTAMIAVER